MKTLIKLLLTLILIITSIDVIAQNKENIKTFINQGIALNDSGKYLSAIGKYKEALNLDPENLQAQYELSYSLSSCGRSKEAIPYLEKVAVSNSFPQAYDLLGCIYDDANDFNKSVAYYKLGILAFPKYSRIYLNLGISYLRQKKYQEAENIAIEAITLDPYHASNQRIYALATYNEDKHEESILAWCSFLLLEPQTNRSEEGFKYIQKILAYGIKRNSDKSVIINISSDDLKSEKLPISLAVLQATDNKKNLTSIDSLSLQLTSVFKIIKEIEEANRPKTFFYNFYAKYFGELAQSPNMPALARLFSSSVNKNEFSKWAKNNPKQIADLETWMKLTERRFN